MSAVRSVGTRAGAGRRTATAIGVALAVLLVASAPAVGAEGSSRSQAAPTRTPIEHVVTVMQEGHTFDNYFGSFPGADGIPANTCMPVSPPQAEPCVKPFPLGTVPLRDLERGAGAFRTAEANGAMNGFVKAQSRAGVVEDQAMGTYDRSTLPYYWNVAERNVLFDRFFASAPGGSLPNHLAWIAGTRGAAAAASGEIPAGGFDLPTIFDELEAKGISWKFYVQSYDSRVTFRRAPGSAHRAQVVRVPLLASPRYVDDPELFSHIVPVSEYFADLQANRLPAVSYIVPSGPSERPPSNVQSGARFVQSLVTALSASTAWPTSAFVLTYDGWGGYYDHVAPAGTGFRVPTLLVSPYARVGVVDHTPLETASIPDLIADNWGLTPLAPGAGRLTSAFDFDHGPRRAEAISTVASRTPASSARSGLALSIYAVVILGALVALGAFGLRAHHRTRTGLR